MSQKNQNNSGVQRRGTHRRFPLFLLLTWIVFGFGFGLGVGSAEQLDVNEHNKTYDQSEKMGYQKDLPQVYVCGDSISVGYTPFLKSELKGRFSVVHRRDLATLFPGINDGIRYSGMAHSLIALTQAVLKSEDYQPRYLLLNCGLHDIMRGGGRIKKYESSLSTLIKLAEKYQVQLIWVTTTPMRTGNGRNKKIQEFNAAAREIMRKHKVPVIDLHAQLLTLFKAHQEKKIMKKDGIHFTALGYENQAKFIAEQLEKIVKAENAKR